MKNIISMRKRKTVFFLVFFFFFFFGRDCCVLFSGGSDIIFSYFSGCSHVKPQVWYRAISDEEFVLQCALPDKDATNIYNNSVLKQHEVKWFWHQKDKGHLKAVEESFNVTLQGNALWFKPVRENASGIYICMIRYVMGQRTYISR